MLIPEPAMKTNGENAGIWNRKNTILDIFFGRDKFDRIGQSAAFAALFNKLVHYFTLLVLSRVGTCWLLGGGWVTKKLRQAN